MTFKGTQAWDNFEFFYLIETLNALGQFKKKNSILFLRFLISIFEHFSGDLKLLSSEMDQAEIRLIR